jgi:prepilin-type N-terminal cleavage/methylation domain-containing protein
MARGAFSLLELLIVIMIVSLSYMMVFSSMQKSAKEPKALTPLSLKNTLLNSNTTSGDREFFCVDNSKSCFWYQNGNVMEYEGKIALDALKVYRVGSDDNSYKVDFGRYRDHKISLRFNIYHNGSSSQMIIEQNHKFYYLPTFFGKVTETKSLESAVALWVEPTRAIRSSGEFY